MRLLRSRTALIAAVALTAALLSGCGGSGGSTAKASAKASSAGRAAAARATRAKIKRDWTKFFKASTPTSKRVKLLQHGRRFKRVLIAQSKSPFAQQSSAKVTAVKLHAAKRATVQYTILVAGKPALKKQKGRAVRAGGRWKVSDRAFCRLLAKEGTAPPACPKP